MAIGYDKKKIYFEDPFSSWRTYLSFGELKKRWHGHEGKKKFYNHGVAVFGHRDAFDFKQAVHMD